MKEPEELRSALKQSENRFQMLFDSIEDSVIMFEVLPDGRRGLIKDVNKATCSRLGYTKKELQKMTVVDIDAPESEACKISPKTRYSDGSALFEAVHQAKDGTSIPVEVNAKKFEYEGQTMVLAIARDLSSRKEAEKIREKYLKRLEAEVSVRTAEIQGINNSLKRQIKDRKKAELKAVTAAKDIKGLIDASHQSIFMIDIDGNVIYVNKTIASNLGTTSENLIGKNIYNFIPPELAESRRKQMQGVCETQTPVQFKDSKNGKQMFHTIYPILENDEVVRVAIYTEDISEILHKEIELEQSRHIQSVLFEILSHSQSSNTLEDLLESIHEIMLKELQAENFFVALIDEEKELLKFEYCIDKTLSECPTIYDINNASSKRISLLPIHKNKIIHLTKNEIKKQIESGEIEVSGVIPEVWLGVPLRVRGNAIGVLVIQDYDIIAKYTKQDLQLFAACSDQIALAIERKKFDRISKSARDIFNNIPSGLCIYQFSEPDSLKLVDANPSAEAAVALNLQKNKGKEIDEIWPGAKDYKYFKKFLSPVTSGASFVSGEINFTNKNLKGCFKVHSFHLPGRKLGVAFEDITEQKCAENTIQENEEQYRALFEDNHSVMLIIDPLNGKILDVNKAALNFYGLSKKDLQSKFIHELNTLPLNEVAENMSKAKKENRGSFIFQHNTAGGKIRDVEVFSGPYKFKGETRLISIIHDITERLKSEKALSEAKESAIHANKAKDEFLANISHEIRTPLNGIMGMLQLLQNSHMESEQRGNVEVALQSSRNLLRVLDDILDFSKIEVGTLDILEEPFNLQGLMDECLELFNIQAVEKEVDLSYTIHPDAQGSYIGDEGRIRQVLFNLLGNSIKFTDLGSVKLEVLTPSSTQTKSKKLHFSVKDTGVGIPEDKIESIFESFTQVDGSLRRKYKGAGLGLSIVKRLIGLMNGTIEVTSRLGEGTTIDFSIPLETTDTADKTEKMNAENSAATSPLKIMLVEDELVNRLMARKILEKMGHNIVCAKNGEECLQLLEKENVDVILMDIQMPVLDGLETARRIRTFKKYENFNSTPIIALSAHATTKNIKTAIKIGMNGYISKPFEWALLEKTLYEVISEAST